MPVNSPVRTATVATHAWTKLHAQIMHELGLWPFNTSVLFMHGPTYATVHNLHRCAVEGLQTTHKKNRHSLKKSAPPHPAIASGSILGTPFMPILYDIMHVPSAY